jgi:hypothetical protein
LWSDTCPWNYHLFISANLHKLWAYMWVVLQIWFLLAYLIIIAIMKTVASVVSCVFLHSLWSMYFLSGLE